MKWLTFELAVLGNGGVILIVFLPYIEPNVQYL
jgi:hypothetical protein